MRAARWPAILLVVLVVAAMVAVDRAHEPAPATGHRGPSVPTIPMATASDASFSRWYCPVGVGQGVGSKARITHTVLAISNAADRQRKGVLTLYTAHGAGTPHPVEVGANARTAVDVADYTDQRDAAALLEFDGGGVAVADVVTGPDGVEVASCLNGTASRWYLPMAATTLDAKAELWLFNPLADDAVLHISARSGDEVRVPTDFDSFPVPARSVVRVNLSKVITVRPQFVIDIEARVGQVVPALVQHFDGTKSLQGLGVMNGAPRTETTWLFPVGRHGEDVGETFVIWNPGDAPAEVEVAVTLDGTDYGPVEPFELAVPPTSYVTLSSAQEAFGRVPAGVGHRVLVRSTNGVGVVAAQRLSFRGDDRPGFALTLGAPVGATAWIVPVASLANAQSSVTIVNPSTAGLARVTVEAQAAGRRQAADVAEIAPGARLLLPVSRAFDLARPLVVVRSPSPVVVSSASVVDGGGRVLTLGIPVAGTTSPLNP